LPLRKYRNKKVTFDGYTFDSLKEYRRYIELKLLQKAGEISDLKLQVKFELTINGLKICSYIADFTYTQAGDKVVEDVKGVKTREYILKKKLMLAIHGIKIKEV
jgi:hypothetical protein